MKIKNTSLRTCGIQIAFAAMLLAPVLSFSGQENPTTRWEAEVHATAKFIPVASITVASVTLHDYSTGVLITLSLPEQKPQIGCYAGVSDVSLPCEQEVLISKTAVVTYL